MGTWAFAARGLGGLVACVHAACLEEWTVLRSGHYNMYFSVQGARHYKMYFSIQSTTRCAFARSACNVHYMRMAGTRCGIFQRGWLEQLCRGAERCWCAAVKLGAAVNQKEKRKLGPGLSWCCRGWELGWKGSRRARRHGCPPVHHTSDALLRWQGRGPQRRWGAPANGGGAPQRRTQKRTSAAHPRRPSARPRRRRRRPFPTSRSGWAGRRRC